MPVAPPPSLIWRRIVPIFDWVTLATSLALLIGVDMPIVAESPEYTDLLHIMFAVFGVFLAMFILENFVFRKRFATEVRKGDGFFAVFIFIRNLFFIINFIPVVHLLALVVMPVVGPAFVLGYTIFLIVRRRNVLPVPAPPHA